MAKFQNLQNNFAKIRFKKMQKKMVIIFYLLSSYKAKVSFLYSVSTLAELLTEIDATNHNMSGIK